MGLSGRVRNGSLGAVFAIAVLALAFTASAGASRSKYTTGFSDTPIRDRAALSSGDINVFMSSRPARTVKLTTRGVHGGPRLTKPRKVSLTPSQQEVSLPLTASGREVLEACGARNVKL